MDNQQKKILIVEDDQDLRRVLADRLGASNYHILEAGDGEEAVTLVLDHKPHLILLDLLLPKLDGFKVLERIRHYPDKKVAETKVIVLSNLWSDKDILSVQALKIDQYYVKANTNLEDVYTKVQEIISDLT